ncbi:MAG: DUF4157 domain-containing protein [Herpetosiphonaceae bacterium]|nr:DUF4157 domain-containing protein [Herpetosiphonaceae bacterium]
MSSHQHDQKKSTLPPGLTSATPEHEAAQHPLLQLGQQVGNAQVARMLAQRSADPNVQREAEEEEVLQASRDSSIQREAEEEEVLQASRDSSIQRRSDSEDSPEVGLEGGPVSSETAARIQNKRGGGSPLPDPTRNFMEERFGTDFSDVRVHTDGESAKLNRRVGATAFTTGSDIFFGANGNASDQQLLGHELTHVVQQRSMSASGPMTVGPDGDQHEQEATQMSTQVQNGPTHT